MIKKILRIMPLDDLEAADAAFVGEVLPAALAVAGADVFSVETGISVQVGEGAVATGAEVGAGSPLQLPADAFDRRRNQYAAAGFLTALVQVREEETMLLGITGVDLFVPRLNFVFGVADPAAEVAVISLHRLRPEFYGEEPDPELFGRRVIKEAVHELGHVLGLAHCQDPDCIMHFSNSIAVTDRKGPGFCGRCEARL